MGSSAFSRGSLGSAVSAAVADSAAAKSGAAIGPSGSMAASSRSITSTVVRSSPTIWNRPSSVRTVPEGTPSTALITISLAHSSGVVEATPTQVRPRRPERSDWRVASTTVSSKRRRDSASGSRSVTSVEIVARRARTTDGCQGDTGSPGPSQLVAGVESAGSDGAQALTSRARAKTRRGCITMANGRPPRFLSSTVPIVVRRPHVATRGHPV